jgi:arylsulfatase A-like enzyme
VARLESQSPAVPLSANIAGIGTIFAGASMTQLFNSPAIDPRTPDIIVSPIPGVIYTGSTKKQEEHGGFAHDDTNVIMLVSNPKLGAKTVTSPVETTQVAPTILKALGLDANKLQAVQIEGTQVLPGIDLDE